jgi:hypothetical protein
MAGAPLTYKVTIEVQPELWTSFKALAVGRESSIQRELGRLVEREVRAAEQRERRRLAKGKAFDRLVAQIEEGQSGQRGQRRRGR